MTLTIHRGTNEIGGSCIEISTTTTTILLDYGTQLTEDAKPLNINKKVDAILISHPHQDHYGEITALDTNLPVYCGEVASKLMQATKIFTGKEKLSNSFTHYEAWKSFNIGDIKITPYLVDHSAMDAYAFLIEAENKKVFYSGDFRANGRKAKLFDKMLENKKLKDIDILLMEGTMIERSNLDFPDEQSVENKIAEVLQASSELTFYIGSSQNIDSIVSAYRACKRAQKIFVVDMYTAYILEIASEHAKIPNISWHDVLVINYNSSTYYTNMKNNKDIMGSFTSRLFKNTVRMEDLKNNPSQYMLKITPKLIYKLLHELEHNNANIIYSQWLGYMLEKHSDAKTVKLFEDLKSKYNWIYAHTSGHADLEALKLFASSLKPKKLIPIHTEKKEDFAKHFENVFVLDDGVEFEV